MRLLTRILVTLTAATALSGVAVTTSSAAPVSTAATSQAAAARCQWSIVGTNVRVRDRPSINGTIVRIKQNGERVTGPAPCAATVYADGYWWVKLYLGSGGYGWTAEPYLHYIGSS